MSVKIARGEKKGVSSCKKKIISFLVDGVEVQQGTFIVTNCVPRSNCTTLSQKQITKSLISIEKLL